MSDHKKEFLDASDSRRWESANRFWDGVLKERSDLNGKRVSFPSRGMNCLVAMTEEEVFKTPLAHVDLKSFETESRLLQFLEDKNLGLSVPRVTCTGENSTFFGMTRMKGVFLEAGVVESMPEQEQRALAKSIATFNARLSKTITVEESQEKGLNIPSARMSKEQIDSVLAKPEMKQLLGEHYDFCCRAAEAYQRSVAKKNEGKPLMLLHGDMNHGNMIYDQDKKKLAMIDPGGMAFGHPEMAFMMFVSNFPPKFADMMLEEYSNQQGTNVTRQEVILADLVSSVRSLPYNNERGQQHIVGLIGKCREKLERDGMPAEKHSPQKPKGLDL